MTDLYVAFPSPVNSTDAPNARPWTFFVDRVNGLWRKGAGDFIRCGESLIEAKAELPTDAYRAMLKKLLFNDSTVKKLVCIAKNTTLSASSHVNRLPPCWSTLYALSQVPESVLKDALADGRIHSGMSRRDATALKPVKKTATKPATAEPSMSTPADLTIDVWESFPKDQRRALFDQLGREGLCADMSPTLLADLRDHVVGLAVAGASKSSVFARYCTDKLQSALYCAGRPEPDLKRVMALLNCIIKNAADKGIAGSDIVIAEGKPKGRRK